MKGFIKSDMMLCLQISLSYYIFWTLAIFLSGGGNILFLGKAIVPSSWNILFVTLINLLLHLAVIPFLRTKKIKWRWVMLVLVLLFLLLTAGFKSWSRLGELLAVLPRLESPSFSMDTEVKTVLFELFGLGYFASIKFYADSYRLKLNNQQLSIEKRTSELNYLRSQTNPHFLFNTLNNIYALSRDKSDLAPESLLRLSGILRYMLYETHVDRVPLEKEIQIIKDYIELEKLRYDPSVSISIVTNTDGATVGIPPLLIVPLVENAFKHGISEIIGEPFIRISISINQLNLHFAVENSIDAHRASEPVIENIGIGNLRRQLQLLFSDYELKIEKRDRTFFAGMQINLNSYATN